MGTWRRRFGWFFCSCTSENTDAPDGGTHAKCMVVSGRGCDGIGLAPAPRPVNFKYGCITTGANWSAMAFPVSSVITENMRAWTPFPPEVQVRQLKPMLLGLGRRGLTKN